MIGKKRLSLPVRSWASYFHLGSDSHLDDHRSDASHRTFTEFAKNAKYAIFVY